MKKRIVTVVLALGLCMTSGCGFSIQRPGLTESSTEESAASEEAEESVESSEETVSEEATDIILDETEAFIVDALKAVYECDGVDGLKEKMDEIAPDSLYAKQDDYYMWASDDLDLDAGTYTWYLTYDPEEGVGFSYQDTAQDDEMMDVIVSTLTEGGCPVEEIGSIDESVILSNLEDSELAHKIFTTTEDEGAYGYYAANLMMTVGEYYEKYAVADEEYEPTDEVQNLMLDGWEAYYQDDTAVAFQRSDGLDVEFWITKEDWASVSEMMEAYGCENYEMVGTYSGCEVWRELHTYDDVSWYAYYSLVDGYEINFSDFDEGASDEDIEEVISAAKALVSWADSQQTAEE